MWLEPISMHQVDDVFWNRIELGWKSSLYDAAAKSGPTPRALGEALLWCTVANGRSSAVTNRTIFSNHLESKSFCDCINKWNEMKWNEMKWKNQLSFSRLALYKTNMSSLQKKTQISRIITHTVCYQNAEGRTGMFHQSIRNGKKSVKHFNNKISSFHRIVSLNTTNYDLEKEHDYSFTLLSS